MRSIPTAPCLALIHEFEGDQGLFEPTRTQDPSGNWEIGWSHKLSGPDDPLWSDILDESAADALALKDLTAAAQGVCNALTVAVNSLTDSQYAACIDFAYNEGAHAFAGSTLCHFITIGSMNLVPAQFLRWVYEKEDGQMVQSKGLLRRRNAEVRVWQS